MMRFGKSARPIRQQWSEEELSDKSAFDLMQMWLTHVELQQRCRNATLLTDPIWYLVKRPFVNLDEMNDADVLLWGTAMDRYDGILKQMLWSQSVAPEDAALIMVNVSRGARGRLVGEHDHTRVPVALWHAFAVAQGGTPASLKAKFMLRAFVDEIKTSDERGVLIALAYSGTPPANVTTRELRKRLNRGYKLLHQWLLSWGPRVDKITDGALRYSDLQALEDPVPFYEKMLMTA